MAKKKALLRQKKNLKRVEKAVKKLGQQEVEVNDVFLSPEETTPKGNKTLRLFKKLLSKVTPKSNKQLEVKTPTPKLPKVKSSRVKKPKKSKTKVTSQRKLKPKKSRKKVTQEPIQLEKPTIETIEEFNPYDTIEPETDKWVEQDDYLVNNTTGEFYKKPPEWDYQEFDTMIINQFLNDIAHFPIMAQPLLTSWLNGMIEAQGKSRVAIMLEEANQSGVWISREIAYNRDKMIQMVSDMLDFLPDIGTLEQEQMTEAFEYSEDWNDFS